MGQVDKKEIDFSTPNRKSEERKKNGEKSEKYVLKNVKESKTDRKDLISQIKKLRAAQSKMLKSVGEMSQLFDYAPASYFIVNKKGVIVNVNNMAVEKFGVEKEQLIGKHLTSFLSSKSYKDDFHRHRQQVIETGKNLQFECEIKRRDGSVFFALIESSVVRDTESNFKHCFLIISDISEQKEHEHKIALALLKEIELNEMKSQFITIASHEFRTPLYTILTSSELIEKYTIATDESKRENHFRKIKTSVQRLNEILMDFMSANELEKGKVSNHPEPVNLKKFIETIIDEVKSFNGSHHVIYKHIGSYQNAFLDIKLLKSVMSNLLINAYKYSPNGGVVEIISEQNLPGEISISVRDNGIGIPEKDQPRIFKQFFRAENAGNIQGTGLGLNIVKKIINLMGAKISFISKENEGSTFFIKFTELKKISVL